MRTKGLIRNFYYNYRNVIDFNKNIIISAIITAITDIAIVVAASSIFQTNNFFISLSSLIADFIIFNSILLFLLYADSKKRQQQNMKPPSRTEMKTLLAKLVATLGISEISYLTTKFVSTYVFLSNVDLTSSQISITTTVVAWVVYLATANIMLKKTNLFS
ncbi:MAG TPA: hypothetical protein VFT71_04370 [Candidatus Nitrosocosmicus sp.]|nr:hypothetical protein [Candidatus Nitrosocosmicus sp.]